MKIPFAFLHTLCITWSMFLITPAAPAQPSSAVSIRVDTHALVRRMQGGIGASWHAISEEPELHNDWYLYPVGLKNPRGSAFGGNPPLEDTAAWRQLCDHASWLGLDFIRVELSQRMYEPERRVFDWDNSEMQALYRILDWCEANGADVLLQQMWSYVSWNAFPKVHPLISSPRSLDDFTHGIATMLKYLTEEKGYTCIKYFCMTNEPPGGPWGYWWLSGSFEGPTVSEAWLALHEEFSRQGIEIPIAGPDWTSLPPLETHKMDFTPWLGALDIHSYWGIYGKDGGRDIVHDWVRFADILDKPFFIAELGNMSLGWGDDNPGPKTFKAALSNASDVALCMDLGVDGFNRWSFTNRGNLDGQWQLVITYDREKKEYVRNIIPEKQAYYGFAMLTRFMGKHATVLSTTADRDVEGLLVTAFRNTDGSLGVLIVNNGKKPVEADILFEQIDSKTAWHHYQVTEALIEKPEFTMQPYMSYKATARVRQALFLPESINVITSSRLKHSDPGIIR